MTTSVGENRPAGIRTFETFDFVSLQTGNQLAKLVDALHLTKAAVSITAQHTPTAEDPAPQKVRVGGTPVQIDVFRGALNVYKQSVQDGLSGRALSNVMDDYFERTRLEHAK